MPTGRTGATADEDGFRTAQELAAQVLGPGTWAWPVGQVRNVVPASDLGYRWPSPLAHFTVWQTEGTPQVDGAWVPTDPESPLADRHWFALLAALEEETG